jgi:hypothetical protein
MTPLRGCRPQAVRARAPSEAPGTEDSSQWTAVPPDLELFCKLKQFERIAMKADETDQSFAALLYLTAPAIP